MKNIKARILIIDDDEEMCAELKDILKSEGYAVDMEHSGDAGKRLADKGRYDIILLDLKMPGLDGYSVLESIKAKKTGEKIIVISAKLLKDEEFKKQRMPRHFTEKEAILDAADDVISKPFDVENMISRIKAMAERANPA